MEKDRDYNTLIALKLTRVLLVDDHSLVLAGLRQLIVHEPDLKVCGEAANVSEAIPMAKETRPDVAIIDISLSDGSNLHLIGRRIHATAPADRIPVR